MDSEGANFLYTNDKLCKHTLHTGDKKCMTFLEMIHQILTVFRLNYSLSFNCFWASETEKIRIENAMKLLD